MSNRINPESDHKTACRVFLELAADDLEKAKRTRDHYAGLARRYGLTNAEIGEALGISEARVRQIVAGGA
jgi:DNA-directed RNA polymerase sigma subunit (sigma70/sigma32)